MAPKTSPKKDFVVSFGLQKPVAEILAAAEKSGMKLSRAYIDILRKKLGGGSKGAAPAKRKPGRPKKSASASAAPAAKRGPGRPKKSAAPAAAAAPAAKRRGRPAKSAGSRPASGGADGAFRSAAAHLVIESGAARARQLLDDVVARIRSSAG